MTGAATAARASRDAPARRRHEGLAIGAVGAAAVWMWLLVSDMHSRVPFSTPAFLGRGLLSIDAPGARLPALAGVVAFTIAHYAAWMAVGTLVIGAVKRATRTPSLLPGVILLLILMQLLFVGITAILAQGRMGADAWRDLMVGYAIGWGAVAGTSAVPTGSFAARLARAAEDDDA